LKKFGFTLAEVLLSMAIVGIVAAATVPSLSINAKKQGFATLLSTQVSDLEGAFGRMMLAENVADLTETRFFQDLQAGQSARAFETGNVAGDPYEPLGTYINITGPSANGVLDSYNGKRFTRIKSNDRVEQIRNTVNASTVTKNGAVIMIYTNPVERNLAAFGCPTNSRAGFLYIDVNGANSPNKAGIDVFMFTLGGDGKLYPAGSRFSEILTNGDDRIRGSRRIANSCGRAGEAGYNNSGYGTGVGCTSRLVEDNYRVNY